MLTLNFSDNLTAIEAGKPYIVKWSKDAGYDANPGGGGVREFVLNFGDEEQPLSISPVGERTEAFPQEGLDGVWYSLDGRKLSGKPTQKGLYIHGGKKVVIP